MEFCEKFNCTTCCEKPNIYLLVEDVNNITANGFYDVYFVAESKGIKTIRTKDDGSCIFYQRELDSCEIYKSRPKQCRLRPNILIDYNGNIEKDSECNHSDEYREDS